MKNYPLDKYNFYTDGHSVVVATSTYAGKTVRGVAKTHPGDEFNFESGKMLAAARCAEKVARKRIERASAKVCEANQVVKQAQRHMEKMVDYKYDAVQALCDAATQVQYLEQNM